MDVLQAYQHLPVHPLWQLCQVVKICDSYHILYIITITLAIKELVASGSPSLALFCGLPLLLHKSQTCLHMLMMPFCGNLLTISLSTLHTTSYYLPNKLSFSLSLTTLVFLMRNANKFMGLPCKSLALKLTLTA